MVSAEVKNIEPDPWYDRGIKYCLYGLIILVPAVFSPWFHTAFSMPKLLVLRFITLAIIALWGCKIFVEEKFSWRKSALNGFIILYAIVSVITTVFSTVFYTSLYGAESRFLGIFTVLNFLLLPIIIFNFLNRKDLKNFIIVSVITASALAIYGLLQYFGIGQDGFNWGQSPADRVFGSVGHANHFGAYLGMNILAGMHVAKRTLLKWLLIVGITLQTIVLFLTGSRGAVFAVMFGLAVTFIVLAHRHHLQVKKFLAKWAKYLIGSMLALLLGLIIFWPHISKITLIERTIGTFQFVQQGNMPDRLSWWMSSFEMIKDKPFLGHGLSTFRDIYNQYRRTDYKVPGPGDMQNLITPEAAHNEYLNIAATQGLIGLLSFLAIVFFVFWKMDRVLFLPDNDEEFYLALGIKGALMVHLVQTFVSFGVITTLTMFFLFLGIGITVASASAKKETMPCRGFAKYFVSILLLAGVCAGAYFTFLEGRAEYFYRQAQVAGAAGQMENAIENHQRAILDKPFEYAYFQALADFALKTASIKTLNSDVQIKLLKLAVMNYQSAIKINPTHPSTFYNLGIAELQLHAISGDESYYQAASAHLARSVELAVNNPLYANQVNQALMDVKKSASQTSP